MIDCLWTLVNISKSENDEYLELIAQNETISLIVHALESDDYQIYFPAIRAIGGISLISNDFVLKRTIFEGVFTNLNSILKNCST
jgi:hypothetical protein